jgi:hypothetical protein
VEPDVTPIETNFENINHNLIENANTDDGNGNTLFRFKQELRDTEVIINSLNNHYTIIRNSGDIIINSAIEYPNIEGTKIIEYSHSSREYNGAPVDLTNFTILLKNDKILRVRIFSRYSNARETNALFLYSLKEYTRSKGNYEYGKALKSLKDNGAKEMVNSFNIKLLINTLNDEDGIHQYIKLNPISSVYSFVDDVYTNFVIEVYYNSASQEASEYIEALIDRINYS